MNVLIAGGGTAGHVFPGLAVAEVLVSKGDRVRFIGSPDGQEARLVPAAGFAFEAVRAVSAQTRLSWRSVHAVTSAIVGGWRLRRTVAGADVVLGVGGFASAPAVLAARWTRTPLVLLEPNSVPGAVNRIAARWSRAVATLFAATEARLPRGTRVLRTGNPLRAAIVAAAADGDGLRTAARAAFGLEEGRATVLVVGGSLGARRIDEAIAGARAILAGRADLQLLVATGPANVDVLAPVAGSDGSLLVHVEPFIERMDLALAVADLAVARAGASVAELAACGVPAILVPYPYATEHHQDANAAELVEAGAAVVLEDAACTPEAVAACILELMDAPERRRAMSAAARAWARPDAARDLVALLREVAG